MSGAEASVKASPFLRWVGGKTYLLPEIAKRIPTAWDRETDLYIEPFLGAGALFWALQPKYAHLNDINHALFRSWLAVQCSVDQLIRDLHELTTAYRTALDPERYYYQIRDLDRAGDPESVVQTAARLIFLNKTCFNGLYRVNAHGEFNVPWGKDPARTICDPELLCACSARLQSVILENADFENLSFEPGGALVYCDPPYVPISKTSHFTSYTQDGFAYLDQLRLAVWAATLREHGAHVILSQAAYEPLIDQYRNLGFTCDLVQAPRRVNSKGAGRGCVGEYIIY
jgi:DNA adenine methylase